MSTNFGEHQNRADNLFPEIDARSCEITCTACLNYRFAADLDGSNVYLARCKAALLVGQQQRNQSHCAIKGNLHIMS
ncbi:MAG: hypothetical protein ACM3SW_12480, partial [Actinomycetota bacterium]